jgi:hypothetical protein
MNRKVIPILTMLVLQWASFYWLFASSSFSSSWTQVVAFVGSNALLITLYSLYITASKSKSTYSKLPFRIAGLHLLSAVFWSLVVLPY